MIEIVYIGSNKINRYNNLGKIDDYFITRIDWNDFDLNTFGDDIDLIIVEEPIDNRFRTTCKDIKENNNLKDIPLVALISDFVENGCHADLLISDNINDDEFCYHIKAIIKNKQIQKRLKKEKELYEIISNEQEKYRAMIENMKSGVAVLQTYDDGDTFTFIEFNRYAQGLFKKQNVIGKELHKAIPEIESTDILDTIRKVWKTNKSRKIDSFRFCNSDGKDLWGTAFVYKLIKTGEIVCIIDDITIYKSVQQRLKIEKDNAVEINKIKSALLINMAHEIRVPINSIIGFTDLLIKNNLTQERIKNYLDIIKNSSDSLLTIVNDIMDLSKIENNKIKIYKRQFNLNILMNNLKIECYENFKDYTNINFNIDIPNINYKLYSDENRIKQVLNNLINNAIKFTEKGSITCGYKLKKDNIEFFVKDTGVGIDKKHIDIIFDRFIQLDDGKDLSNKYGIGLGLTISKSMVELLGGKIWVTSKKGVGSTFYFTIPLEKGVDDDIKFSKIQLNISRTYDWRGKRVLIVEDNYNNYLLTEINLSQTDIIIDHVKNVEEFINVLENNTYDIILMDFQLPDGDGFNLLDYMVENDIKIPVIIVTAFASKDDELELYKLGVDAYITKPVKWDYLYNNMDKILSK